LKAALVMTGEGPWDLSQLIAAWGRGDEGALTELIPLVYPELRRIARRHLARCQPGNTLESAALANEAYLKLVRAGSVPCENRAHFLALCSQVIRRILVDRARNRAYACHADQGGSPLMLRAIAAAKKKNDQIDASKIADCLRCDFLPECHMMPTEIRDRRRTLRYRHLLVRQMVQMKNRVSGC
jgi:RNA polymerase sigma factor (TIGR02999 family)